MLEKLYNQSLNFLSYRPRSEYELRTFLARKNKIGEKKLVDQVIARLREEKLVNDHEFVDWWLEQRAEFNPRGERALKQELFQKGIDRELIEWKLAKINKSEYKKLAKKVLEKKRGFKKEKLLTLLIRRGFNYGTSIAAIDEFL